MMEQPQQQQGEVLAVHQSQLTREGVAQLAREGYGILPDQSGWLVFVRSRPMAAQQPDGGDDA